MAKKNYAGSEKPLPTLIKEKEPLYLVPSTVKLLHQRINKKINRDQEGCRLDLKPSPDEINNSAGKGTSGMTNFNAKYFFAEYCGEL